MSNVNFNVLFVKTEDFISLAVKEKNVEKLFFFKLTAKRGRAYTVPAGLRNIRAIEISVTKQFPLTNDVAEKTTVKITLSRT